jgi:predicted  nucleic acid-binding Zn-ribbon protein
MPEFKKPALIREHMLEEDYRKQIRKKDEKINLNDLDPGIVTVLTNINPGNNAYNDSELRNRIIKLENGKVTAGDVFVKGVDKVKPENLNGLTKQAYDWANEVPSIKTGKADKSYVDTNFRNNAVPIIQGDFDPILFKKINDMQSELNTIKANFDAKNTLVSQLSTINTNISNLSTNKADLSYAENTYRKKSAQISLADTDASIQTPISKINSVLGQINSMASADDLAKNYRKTAVPIKMTDLDAGLQANINQAQKAATDFNSAAGAVFDSKFNSTGKSWIFGAYGEPKLGTNKMNGLTPYAFALEVTNFCGTTGSSGAFTFASALSLLYQEKEALKTRCANLESRVTNLQNSLNSKADTSTVNNKADKSTVSSIESRLKALEDKAKSKGW